MSRSLGRHGGSEGSLIDRVDPPSASGAGGASRALSVPPGRRRVVSWRRVYNLGFWLLPALGVLSLIRGNALSGAVTLGLWMLLAYISKRF